MKCIMAAAAACLCAASVFAQTTTSQEAPMNAATAAVPVQVTASPVSTARTLPAGTMIVVTPLQEISSKHVEVGQNYKFQVVNDIVQDGMVIIPRGSPVTGTITWKTGRAIGGKSGKFEVTFATVSVGGHDVKLSGKHRQEGRGNTVGALLGSIVISGRSAVMDQGQLVNCFTNEPVAF